MGFIEDQNALIEKLKLWLKGDQWAIQFCLDIVFVAHLWDDLTDKDKQRSEKDISDAFILSLVNIPGNPFYAKFSFDLRPVMMNAIIQWQSANVLETGSKEDRDKAFMLRASILQIIHYCSYLIGGVDWAKESGPEIYRYYQETIDSYMEGKTCQPQ